MIGEVPAERGGRQSGAVQQNRCVEGARGHHDDVGADVLTTDELDTGDALSIHDDATDLGGTNTHPGVCEDVVGCDVVDRGGIQKPSCHWLSDDDAAVFGEPIAQPFHDATLTYGGVERVVVDIEIALGVTEVAIPLGFRHHRPPFERGRPRAVVRPEHTLAACRRRRRCAGQAGRGCCLVEIPQIAGNSGEVGIRILLKAGLVAYMATGWV